MSSHHLQDYIDDVPMDIGSNFYPLPLVNVPDLPISIPKLPVYSFETERRAVAQYNEDCAKVAAAAAAAKEAPPPPEPPVIQAANLRKVRSVEILEPSPAPSISSPRNATNMKVLVNSFEEFEVKPNLFDLLEMHTIDDKAALEQVLTGTSNSGCLSSVAVAGQNRTQIASHAAPSTALSASANIVNSSATSSCPSLPQSAMNNETLQNRDGKSQEAIKQLSAKGYPQLYIWQCIRSLPEHLLPQAESYVKSVTALSKMGADSDYTINSLMRLNLPDETRFNSFVDAATQLCALGFGVNAVINALCVCGARRDAALERLLEK